MSTIPTNTDIKPYVIKKFLGLNLTSTGDTQILDGESGNMSNFVITDDKLTEKLGGISYQQKEYPLGEILAQLTYEKLKNNQCKWQELKPLYIQPPPMG
jgi:hypothetical protein